MRRALLKIQSTIAYEQRLQEFPTFNRFRIISDPTKLFSEVHLTAKERAGTNISHGITSNGK